VINAQVRHADLKDQQRLSNLVFFETRSHRHLDWRSPLEWLGNRYFWAVENDSSITAALACPEETQGIAWVRLFVSSAVHWSPQNAWTVLWDLAKRDIAQAGGVRVAAIVQHYWFQKVLEAAGFENRQNIVMLEWDGFASQPRAAREADGIRIRQMTEADLPDVVVVDHASFDPLWHNSLETLQRAFSQSLFATVAENEKGVVGYQVTTGSNTHAHLARLAVHPSMQRRGNASIILSDLFSRLAPAGYRKLTVNTQSDNQTSLRLYKKMGFVRTGQTYPVYTFDVPAYPG
jgi:ribosomal-protein-alanine N-acetyltransferase